MRRKGLALTMALLMAVSSLAGCGSAEKAKTNTAANETAREAGSNPGTESAQPSASDEEEITVTFMVSGVKSANGEDFFVDTIPRLVKEKYPNITVETTKLPDDQYYTALKTKLATGEAPDLLWVQPRYAGVNSSYALAEAGYLEDISDLECTKLVGNGIDSFTYQGKVYGVPAGVMFLGTWYNKAIFEENGLDVPTSWQEFLVCCETLKKAGIQPIVMGDKDMYEMQFGLYQVAANMVYPDDPEFDEKLRDGSRKFTDEGTWDKVIERYYELYEKEYIQSGSLGLGIAQAQQKFADGEAAMIIDGSFNRRAVTAQGTVEFERGFFPLPGNDEGKELYVSGTPGTGIAIYSGSKNKDACKKIVELWFDGQSDLYKAYESDGKFISSNQGAVIDPIWEPLMKRYSDGYSFYWCNQAWPAGTETEMEALFGELIGNTGTTVNDITEGMQNKLEELLQQ